MADVELVIKVPEDIFDYVMNTGRYGRYHFDSARAIRNGTPLPKGHGRLIDADALVYKQTHHGNYYTQFELINRNDLSNAPTIIEADKAESEDE